MAHYLKRNQNDIFDDIKQQRVARKSRGHRNGSEAGRLGRQHGWSYLKRRAVSNE